MLACAAEEYICMLVRVELSEEDLKLGLRRVYAQLGRKSLLIIYMIAVAIGIAVDKPLLALLQKQAFYKSMPAGMQEFVAIALFVAIVLLVFRFLLRYSPQRQYYRPEGILRSSREIRIDRDGVHQDGKHSTSLTRWGGIMKIQEDKDFILFYVDPAAAYIIPKHFFASPEDAAAFAAQARDFWNAAKQAETVTGSNDSAAGAA